MKPFKSKPVYFAVLMALTTLPLSGKAAESATATTAEGESAVLPEVSVSTEREVAPPFRADTSSNVTKIAAPLRDIPQSISVVTEELIESQRAFNLRDALRNVSGLTIAAGEGGRTGDSITLRGFAANSDLYLDGVKDNGQYNRDTFFLERVEVLKGPSSILFGRGSTGGVINQASKQADGKERLEAVVTGGSYDFKRATVDVSTAVTDNVSVRLNALYQDSDSFRDHNFLERKGVAPSVKFSFTEDTTLTLNYLYQEEDGVFDYGVPMLGGRPADVPRTRFYGWKEDRLSTYDTDIASAILTHNFTEDFSVRNTLRYGDYYRKYRTLLPSSINQSAATATYSQALRDSHQQNLFNQTDFTLKKPLFGLGNTLAFGTEFGKEDFDFRSKNSTPNLPVSIFNPVFPDTIGAGRANDFSGTLATNRQVETYTRAAYVLDQLELNPQWKLQLGLRYDDFEADQLNVLNGDKFGSRDYVLSKRAGLVWQPSDAESYYVSYGTSFNPSAETFSLAADTTNLDPEKNRNIELGGKWEVFDGRMTLSSAVYQLKKTDARADDPTNPDLTILSGEQRTNGFEVELAGEVMPNWNLSAAYAYLDSEVTKSTTITAGSVTGIDKSVEGMTPQNVARNSGAIWTTYRFLENWEIGGGVFFVGRRYTDTVEEVELPGYARIDAVLAYHQPRYDIQLNLYNLADKRYFESGQTRTALPGVPFSGQLTVAVHF